jgi:hypothetical protein
MGSGRGGVTVSIVMELQPETRSLLQAGGMKLGGLWSGAVGAGLASLRWG